jgi:Ca-activated chloride channel family protein
VAVSDLVANGGTAMGTWLTLADKLLGAYPSAVRHAMLFTDGRNEHETPEQLTRVLDQIRGRFVCDVRGIGDAWEPRELQRIVSVLNGQARSVAEFADMTADFTALMRDAMRKVVPDVDLRLRTLGGTRVRYLKQVFPSIVELTDQLVHEDELTVRLATGAWGDEMREYHLCVDVDSTGRPIDQDTLAARIEVHVHGATATPVPPGLVLVNWSDEPLQVTRIDANVAHYTGQQELSDVVNQGCAAARKGDRDTAEQKFGRAVQLATESGNQTILDLLARLVDIVDGKEGKVRLKAKPEAIHVKQAELGSILSSNTGNRTPQQAPSGPPRQCPSCRRMNDADADVCENCGHTFAIEQP